jgi:hypothetical protein
MADNPLPGQLASMAEEIVNTLTQTDYQFVENIDPAEGVYDCDCNGFVGYVLETLAPAHYSQVPVEPGFELPRAWKYFEFFAAHTPETSNGWRRVDLLGHARRGDIVAWRFPLIKTGHNTGHVLFLAESPVPMTDQPGYFSVRVYDSADGPHFDDTRGPGKKFPKGVGSGFINFQVDGEGRPIAFQFAPGEDFETFAIAIGRVEPF